MVTVNLHQKNKIFETTAMKETEIMLIFKRTISMKRTP